MPPTISKPALSSYTRAELSAIARSLRSMRVKNHSKQTYRLWIEGTNKQGSNAPSLEIAVSPEAIERIVHLITEASKETAPLRYADELTTQEAASLLGVSRPYFIKLLDAGKIPYRRVGHFRRIRREDVERFDQSEQKRRQEGLEELAAFTQEIGLDY